MTNFLKMKNLQRNNRRRPNEKFLSGLERRLAARTRRVFKKQLNYIVEAVKEMPQFQGEPQTNSIDGDINNMLNGMPGQEELAEQIVGVSKVGVDRGGKYIVKELDLGKFGVSWSLQNTAAIKFLGGKLSYELSNFKGNITGTTKKNISKIILDAVEKGESYNKTAKKIMAQGEAGVFSKARAQMIAVRESGVAYEKGKEIVLQDFSNKYPEVKTQKKWQTVNDKNVTPTHTLNQEQGSDDGWIAVTDVFLGTNDMVAPASDNPRCRCFTKYRII